MTRQPHDHAPPAQDEKRDWVDWHRAYDDPSSRLSRRLRVVQQRLTEAIDAAPPGPIRIISMCAGEGRDVVPVVANHPRRADVTARLVELDPQNAAVASQAVRDAQLERVDNLNADAALTDNYAGAIPANIVVACGIFGNIDESDILRTIAYLPSLCAANATVIWTRGRHPDHDRTPVIREWFAKHGFEELAFDGPENDSFSVGVHRLASLPRPFEPGITLFRFTR